MRHFKYIFFLLVILSAAKDLKLHAQTPQLDSLKLLLKNAKNDTTRCNILNAMIEAENDETVWAKYNDQLINISESNLKELLPTHSQFILFKKQLASSLHNGGIIKHTQGNNSKALEFFNRSLKISEEIGDRSGIATSLNAIGAVYSNKGNIPMALEYYGRALKIQEEMHDQNGTAISLINIGFIYQNQGEINKALLYYMKGLKIQEEIGNKYGMARALNNIAFIYQNQGEISKALAYYNKGLKI